MPYLCPAKNRTARQNGIARNLLKYNDMLDVMVSNITATYLRAEDQYDAHAEGLGWYHNANSIARELAQTHDVPFTTAAGVLAVLSPSTNWSRNIALAEEMLATNDCSHAYGELIEKARRIIAGESLDEVMIRGRKVRNFYACIVDPSNPGAVCVDRHAVVLATGRPIQALDGWLDLVGTYQLTAAAYRTVARTLGLLPSQVQAITWCQHRQETDTYKGAF